MDVHVCEYTPKIELVSIHEKLRKVEELWNEFFDIGGGDGRGGQPGWRHAWASETGGVRNRPISAIGRSAV